MREYFIVTEYENNGCDCKTFDTFRVSLREAVYMARQFVRFYGNYCEYSFVTVRVYDDTDRSDADRLVYEAVA